MVITPGASIPPSLLAEVIPALHHLIHLTVLCQDLRVPHRLRGRHSRRTILPSITSGLDTALKRLADARSKAALPALSSLIVIGSADLTESAIVDYLSVGETSRYLKRLQLNACSGIGFDAMLAVAERCRNLRELHVDDLDLCSPASSRRPSLEPVKLPHVSNFDCLPPFYLRHLLVSCPLVKLTLVDVHVPHSLDGVVSQPTLIELTLTSLPDFTPAHLLAFPHVRHLRVSNCIDLAYIPLHDAGLLELRTLSFLGHRGGGLSFHNLWDLCAIGKGEAIRPNGKGKRGLRSLVIDSAACALDNWNGLSHSLLLPH